jgi:hypothetical protein
MICIECQNLFSVFTRHQPAFFADYTKTSGAAV